MHKIKKYPRTPHLEGSRLQAGDHDISQIRFVEIAGRHLVVEEKVDGANCGISFGANGALQLQSRGHFLQGGPRERQFAMLKQWANEKHSELFDRLGGRYIMYGEWMFAKHTVFYDRLPNYFLEFDIYDQHESKFLSTLRRRELLSGSPVHSVPVLHEGVTGSQQTIVDLIGPSVFIGDDAKSVLTKLASEAGQNTEDVRRETDLSGLMEGLYIKVEEGGEVVDRLKFVRAGFLAIVDQSGSHWLDRPVIQNQVAP